MVMKVVKQKISAFFLLGVFLFALSHSVIPHAHHKHEGSESHLHFLSYKKIKKHAQNEYCFLSLTENCSFNNHTHNSCLDDCLLHETPIITSKKVVKTTSISAFTTSIYNHYSFPKAVSLKENIPLHYKKVIYKNPFYLSTSLRAPPLLG